MNLNLRKFTKFVDKTFIEGGKEAKKPVVIDVDVDPKALYSFRRDSFKHKIK